MIEVQGNGNIVTREISVSSFIRLHVSGYGAEIIQSDEEKVTIEADENLHDFFEVVNSGRTLYVTSEAKLRIPVFTKLKVKIYCRQVFVINNSCQGDLSSPNMLQSTEPLELKINSHGNTDLQLGYPLIKLSAACHGNIKLRGECHELTIKNASHGDLDCREMLADKTTITNASHGNVLLYSKEEIRIRHAGQGDIHYYGDGKLKNIVHHGDGEVAHRK